jgi:hypothetical protein
LVRAWHRQRVTSIIATLPDHLDKRLGQKPLIGLVGNDSIDKGLVGGNWYTNQDRDWVSIVDNKSSVGDQSRVALRLLKSEPFGKDAIPDLLAVVMSGPVATLDSALGRLVRAANAASDGSVLTVVTATGVSAKSSAIPGTIVGRRLEGAVEGRRRIIEAIVPGGLYLDQKTLARLKMPDDVILRQLLRLRGPLGEPLMADAFPSFAVTFGRYC